MTLLVDATPRQRLAGWAVLAAVLAVTQWFRSHAEQISALVFSVAFLALCGVLAAQPRRAAVVGLGVFAVACLSRAVAAPWAGAPWHGVAIIVAVWLGLGVMAFGQAMRAARGAPW